MDQELVAYLEQRFVALDERFAAMERKMDERFDQVNESIHRNQILLEETRREVQIVAEG